MNASATGRRRVEDTAGLVTNTQPLLDDWRPPDHLFVGDRTPPAGHANTVAGR